MHDGMDFWNGSCLYVIAKGNTNLNGTALEQTAINY
jgi:hypothetical protein